MSDYKPLAFPEHDPAAPWDAGLVLAILAERIPTDRLFSRQRASDSAALAQYALDATTLPQPCAPPDIAVRVLDVPEVRHVLAVAQHYGVPLYARGLGSGLSGGALPSRGGIVLDLAPMDALLHVDRIGRSAVVQPGLSIARLNAALAGQGLWYPPWPSSQDISSLGGNVAENAGGISTLKYGTTRDWLLGLTAVLPGGALIRTGSRASKDVAGFDLTRLLCGSEGLLGVVVEIELKLLPRPAGIATALYAFNAETQLEADLNAARAVQAVLVSPVTPRALEFMGSSAMQLVRPRLRAAGAGAGLPAGLLEASSPCALLLAETDALNQDEALAQLELLEDIFRGVGASSSGPVADPALAALLWRVRSELSPSCFDLGSLKLAEDVCVPRSELERFIVGLEEVGQSFGLRWLNYGHIGDGNFHCTLMFDDADDPRLSAGQKAVEAVYRLALELGGTISGEHGIGLLKAPYLPLQLGETELALMRGIKAVFDPRGILNPRKWL